MVIKNSEVLLASQGSYQSTTKVDTSISQKPVFKIGDIIIGKEGEDNDFLSSLNYQLNGDGTVSEIGDNPSSESAVANMQTQFQTINYLLRLMLYSRVMGDDNEFTRMLKEMFGQGAGYMQNTEMTYEYTETQEMTFRATGMATTADGRSLEFNYGFAMSESFHQEFKSFSSEYINYVDPLVVNLNDSPAKLSDQTFYFDLDGDGNKEEINQLSVGHGFLALDRNEDGEINDGGELFGARTNDGFRELQLFDEDGNGWIDEEDSIFQKLRIWAMNDSGEMELYTLKQADVGAIYLGRVDTQFIDYDEAHQVRGAMRQTGIFLHESDGHASSVQHIDFAT